jgi:type IV pilus assembly protein PilC
MRKPGGVSTEVLSNFYRRLQAMVVSGVPVHQALEFLRDDEHPVLRAVVQHMVQRLEGGTRLSQAMAENARVFPNLACDLVRAAEVSGNLDTILGTLADQTERSTRLQKKLQAALAYPALLLSLTFGIVMILVVFVFPKEAEMASGLGVEMPALTKALISFANVVGSPLFGLAAALLLGMVVFAWPLYLRPAYLGSRFRRTVERKILHAPIIGPVLAKSAYARMLGAQASLLAAGHSVGPALRVVGSVSLNCHLDAMFQRYIRRVMDGEPMSQAAEDVYPPMVCHMFAIADEQGQLDSLLERMAQMYEEEADTALMTLAALLEPLTLAFMGVVVGVVVVATSLPTLQLMQRL